jgi:hypothetical protein
MTALRMARPRIFEKEARALESCYNINPISYLTHISEGLIRDAGHDSRISVREIGTN